MAAFKSAQSRSKKQPTQQHFSLADVLAALESNGCKVQQANGGWKAQCPAHEDRNPSLSISDKGDKVLLHCHAGCTYPEILTALGFEKSPVPLVRRRPAGGACALPTGPQITTCHYVGADGTPAFAVVRTDAPKGKTISQWTPSPCGEKGLWVPSGYKGKRPLYRLPELLESTGKVVVVEGEKCVDAAQRAFPKTFFTTFAGGSQAWRKTDYSPLIGRNVTLLADTDSIGRECFTAVGDHLATIGVTDIRIGLPAGESKDDIVDWIARGEVGAQLKECVHPLTPNADTPTEDVDGRAYAEIEAEQVNWLWIGRIPFGMLTILDGDPGAGKSQVALDLVARLTTGRSMPLDDGEALPPQGAVLIGCEDSPEHTVRPRLDAAGADTSRVD